ncbi:MAG: hypothetical protein PHE55_23020 [Methylococcaceae bacterium]|nr:hypothetical protein [Methylococcaceae bacterium]
MLFASRIAILGLLALMQLFAPLVHAHAGGGPASVTIHVPGLEFLAQQEGGYVQAFNHPAGFDVIIGLAPGLKHQGDSALPAPDTGSALPACFARLTNPALDRDSFCFFPSVPLLGQSWLTPAPRAPPAALIA